MTTRAVFFDVDFTLIFPGPMFQGAGYASAAARHGMLADPARFAAAVAAASAVLDGHEDEAYSHDLFILYTRRILEGMGCVGAGLDPCASELYDAWAACHHFDLYADAAPALEALSQAGLLLGLISNSHRPMDAFQSHFELTHLITGALSSAAHGVMKPHPRIFQAALALVGVEASAAVMVGDSLKQDVEGALRAGMRAVYLHRSETPHPRTAELAAAGVPTIRTLAELPALLGVDAGAVV